MPSELRTRLKCGWKIAFHKDDENRSIPDVNKVSSRWAARLAALDRFLCSKFNRTDAK
jgi:hypothetical protein